MQWGIESVAALAAYANAGTTDAAASVAPSVPASDTFAILLQRELGELNASVASAETAIRELSAGRPVELHEVMISLERARISVQTFVQVRNKLIESYQDLLRMQL